MIGRARAAALYVVLPLEVTAKKGICLPVLTGWGLLTLLG